MSRIELGGYGPPIPLPEDGLASLDPESSSRLPLVLNLPDGTIFKQADYSAFGYTHYEVLCIGAAGGLGGDAFGGVGGAGGGGGLHIVHGLLADLSEEVLVTVGQAGVRGANGTSAPRYVAALQPFLTNGNHQAAFWTDANPPGHPYDDVSGNAVFPYVKLPNNPYVLLPNVSWAEAQTWGVFVIQDQFRSPYTPPTDGGDGGYTSFGDIAMASGGKAGEKAPRVRDVLWAGLPRMAGGEGGDGGVGGSIVAGGGALGAKYPTDLLAFPEEQFTQAYEDVRLQYEAKNGTWDGTIGQGGGGGRGGSVTA